MDSDYKQRMEKAAEARMRSAARTYDSSSRRDGNNAPNRATRRRLRAQRPRCERVCMKAAPRWRAGR